LEVVWVHIQYFSAYCFKAIRAGFLTVNDKTLEIYGNLAGKSWKSEEAPSS
jgi:hypothetical protein